LITLTKENDILFGSLNHALVMSLISIPTEIEPSRSCLNTLIVNSFSEHSVWNHLVSLSCLRNSVVWDHGVGKYHQCLLNVKNKDKMYRNAVQCNSLYVNDVGDAPLYGARNGVLLVHLNRLTPNNIKELLDIMNCPIDKTRPCFCLWAMIDLQTLDNRGIIVREWLTKC
jgi:hypothetical protein